MTRQRVKQFEHARDLGFLLSYRAVMNVQPRRPDEISKRLLSVPPHLVAQKVVLGVEVRILKCPTQFSIEPSKGNDHADHERFDDERNY